METWHQMILALEHCGHIGKLPAGTFAAWVGNVRQAWGPGPAVALKKINPVLDAQALAVPPDGRFDTLNSGATNGSKEINAKSCSLSTFAG